MFDNYYYDDYYDGDYDEDPEYMEYKRQEKISEKADEWKANTMNMPENKWLLADKKLFGCDLILKHKFHDGAGSLTESKVVVFGIDGVEKGPHITLNYIGLDKILDEEFRNIDLIVEGNVDTAYDIVNNIIKHFDQEQNVMTRKNLFNYLTTSEMHNTLLNIGDENEPKPVQTKTSEHSFMTEHEKNYYQFMDHEREIETGQFKSPVSDRQLETAQKTGYVQGVCESVLAFNTDENRKIMSEATMTFLSKKLLSEMNVTKDMAQKFANPETYKALEKCVFAPKQEQHLEQTQSQGRGM